MALMNVIVKKMPSGFPGQVARQSFNVIESIGISSLNPVTKYGSPVFVEDDGNQAGKMRAIEADDVTDNAAKFWGISVRPDAVQLGGDNPSFDDSGVPDGAQILDVMVRGYINVKLVGNVTPRLGDAVYAIATGDDAGFFTANSSASGAVKIPGAVFVGTKDAYSMAQIRLL